MTRIILWHVKQRKAFIIWWCIAIIGFIGLNLAFYPSFKDQAQQLEKAFSQLSETAVAFFSDTGEFFSPEGYLSSQVFYLMLPMLLSILAINLGNSLLAKEEREGTIELLLSRPISRTQLLNVKILSGLVILGFVGVVATISITLICKMVGIEVPLPNILIASLLSVLFAVTIGAVAFVLSALGRFGRGASIGIATSIALGGYILSSLIGVATWLEWPARFLPFYYYRPAEVLTGTYNWLNTLYFFTLIAFCYLLSVIVFRKRDIG